MSSRTIARSCSPSSIKGRRTERRLGEVRDELKLTIKIALMGRQANFDTINEERLAKRLDEHLASLSQGAAGAPGL